MAKCPYCAKEIAGDEAKCPRCGREAGPPETGAQPAPAAKPGPVRIDLKFDLKFKKETMLVIFLVDACLVLGFIFYFIFRK